MKDTVMSLVYDIGLATVLLLLGQTLRARVVLLQKLFLPANVIAGFMALLTGPNGFAVLPFSESIGIYPGILIALVFASLPFSSSGYNFVLHREAVSKLWAYSSANMLLQWGLGMLFGLLVLSAIWPRLPVGFGSILASGFAGGHGTAAAVGSAFADLGWEEAGTLAMTSATVGILSSVVGGMIWIRWGTRTGATAYVVAFKELRPEMQPGLIPPEQREELGKATVASGTIDPLAFHFAIVFSVTFLAFLAGSWSESVLGNYRVPTFCIAFFTAIILKKVLGRMKALTYIDTKVASHLCGSFTDLLVVFGIAAIKIPLLIKYAVPLSALFLFGLILSWGLFKFMGPKLFAHAWLENALYTWGWVTGIMAMAIALLRIVDPDKRSRILDDFAMAYLGIAPIEISLVSFAPVLIANGHYWSFAMGTTLAGLAILFLPFWWRNKERKALRDGD